MMINCTFGHELTNHRKSRCDFAEMAADETMAGDVPMKSEVVDWKSDNLKKETRWSEIVKFVDGHVDSYDMKSVLQLGYFRVRVPAFNNPFVMWQALRTFLLTWVFCAFFIIAHKINIMHVGDSVVGQTAAIFGYFGGLAGFLFGFFVFSRLGGFIALKNNCLGGFWGAFQDLMALVGIYWPSSDPKTAELKGTVVRWGMASYNLMCGVSDPDVAATECVEECVQRNLLTQEEAALCLASPAALAFTPLLWIVGVLESNVAGLRASDWKMDKLEDKVLGMRMGIGGVLGGVGYFGQFPLPLVHLMSALIKIQLFLLSAKEGVSIASIILGVSSGKTMQISCCMLMVLSTPVIFQGLLEFVNMISNPFGSDWIDFPTHLFHQQIRDEMFQYIKVGELAGNLPKLKRKA
jgi:hypothetical protein